MAWQDELHEAMADYISRAYHGPKNVAKVTGFMQSEPDRYYCETCGPDPITVQIFYDTTDGDSGSYFYYGDLGEFIRELT